MIPLVALSAISYLAGGIPFSYLAGRLLRGIDLRDFGSGNLGASNTFRVLGSKVAIVVLVLDIAKGFSPVAFSGSFAAHSSLGPHWFGAAAMFFAILGHLYSPYLRFAGGKGIATSAGAFAALVPWAFAGALILFAVVFAARRIVSLASIFASLSLPLFVWGTGRLEIGDPHWSLLVVSFVIMCIVIAKHRDNIRRLLAGTEKKLSRAKAP